MTDKALIIFTRNPELGKVKTRLAKTIGQENALKIYNLLLDHTEQVASEIEASRTVYYSIAISNNDIWQDQLYKKLLQHGNTLGKRMHNAFCEQFNDGFTKVVIIGSDLPDLNKSIIDQAYDALNTCDVVLGPATDGGYYLLGMKTPLNQIFQNKTWGTSTVLEETLKDLKEYSVSLLEELNDIDTFEDLKQYPKLLKQISSNDQIH